MMVTWYQKEKLGNHNLHVASEKHILTDRSIETRIGNLMKHIQGSH